ncbi:hypothetical protein [Hyphomicrobium sp. DY-1]|uniref:hypothetical protein n=1 Tax=Hyphomicrobium sp. DY-1 TaxID=3075650 RepID=UPI0039C46A65
MARQPFWTPENSKRLDALVQRNRLVLTIEKAATLLGTSPATVHTEVTRRGLITPGRGSHIWTPAMLSKLNLLLDGKGKLTISNAKAAAVLGCDRHSIITGLILLQGKTPDRLPLTPDTTARIKRLADKDGYLTLSVADAARKIGCSVKVMKRAMRSLNLRSQPVFAWTPDKLGILWSLMDHHGQLTVTQQKAAKSVGCSHRALQLRLAMPPTKRWLPTARPAPQPATANTPQPKPSHPALRALCKDGVLTIPIDKAAARFKVSRQTIRNRLKAIGAKTPPPDHALSTHARDNALKKLCRDGQLTMPVDKAAKHLHCTAETLRRAMKRLHIAFPPRPGIENLQRHRDQRTAQTAQRREKLLTFAKDGVLTLHPNVIAAKLGCRPRTVNNDMTALNLRSAKHQDNIWSAAKEEALRALCAGDRLTVSVARAAQQIGVPPQILDAHLSRLHIMHVQTDPADAGPLLAVLRKWQPNLVPMKVAQAANELPALTTLTKEQISLRAGALSRLLKVTPETAVSMALSAPGLFIDDIAALRATMRQAPPLLGIGPDAYHGWVCETPRVLLLRPAAIIARVDELCAFLHVDRPKLLLFLRRKPQLLQYSCAELECRAQALAAALDLPLESITTAIYRQPQIIVTSPDKLAGHCAHVADLLSTTTHAVAKAFIANPSMLQVKPTSLADNVRAGAALFKCDTAALAAAYLQRPPLLTMRPATLFSRMLDLAAIFHLDHAAMIKEILGHPYLLTFAADNTREKAWLLTKLGEAVGHNRTPADILKHAPMAFTYSKERIASRVEMARQGIGPKSVSALLTMSDRRAAKLVARAEASPNRYH